MKESMFDILIYLFENYMYDESEFTQDREELKVELEQVGFRNSEIGKAFDWLEDLADLQFKPLQLSQDNQKALRIYSERECERLDTSSRGFLLFLEQVGVLDHNSREMVIDRIMALESEDVDMDQLKWVILMVLFNQPGREEAFAWMEDMVLDESATVLH
ncbi:MAG: DUF494 domain-containing protein [Gammaproteobacteria bacterium]|nr:DUF494 domain-containing protein [Gammaproteobacteria bacterium]